MVQIDIESNRNDRTLEQIISDAIGYDLVPLSIRDHPEITREYRSAKDRDGLVERISAALIAEATKPVQRIYPLKINFEDGKYTLIMHKGGTVTALRYGHEWREFIGDKFIYLLARKIFGLQDNE